MATLKGQGDSQQRSGLMIPVLVTGSFKSPKILPDLKGMLGGEGASIDVETLKKNLDPKALKSSITGDNSDQKQKVKDTIKNAEKNIKGLLKGF